MGFQVFFPKKVFCESGVRNMNLKMDLPSVFLSSERVAFKWRCLFQTCQLKELARRKNV